MSAVYQVSSRNSQRSRRLPACGDAVEDADLLQVAHRARDRRGAHARATRRAPTP